MVSVVRKWTSGWIAVTVCAGIVLLAGARLLYLSLQQAASQARIAARALADTDAGALSAQLQAVAALAAQRAAGVDAATPSPPGRNEFWLGNDGRLLGDPGAYRSDAAAIAAAWSEPSARTEDILGPVRVGSHWLVAARAPMGKVRLRMGLRHPGDPHYNEHGWRLEPFFI